MQRFITTKRRFSMNSAEYPVILFYPDLRVPSILYVFDDRCAAENKLTELQIIAYYYGLFYAAERVEDGYEISELKFLCMRSMGAICRIDGKQLADFISAMQSKRGKCLVVVAHYNEIIGDVFAFGFGIKKDGCDKDSPRQSGHTNLRIH